MIAIDPRQAHGLEWHQLSAFGRHHELKTGDTVVAELAFAKALGTLAEARTARGVWTFKRRGILTTTIGARVAGQEKDIAVYQPNWTAHKGLLRLESGEQFHLRAANFWASEWVLSDANGVELIRYHNRGFLKAGAQVELQGPAFAHPMMDLLLTLTWYILLLHQMDSSAVAGAGE
jgi:hypothetical protein